MEFPLFVLLPFLFQCLQCLSIVIPILHTRCMQERTRWVMSLSQVVPVQQQGREKQSTVSFTSEAKLGQNLSLLQTSGDS